MERQDKSYGTRTLDKAQVPIDRYAVTRKRSRKLRKGARIAVLCGGRSSEREVSMASGGAVADALEAAGLKVEMVDISGPYREKLKAYRPKAAFLALHGGFGEDGGVQAALEEQDVRYTGSGPMASLVAMDKEIAKRAFARAGLVSPPAVYLSRRPPLSDVETAVKALGLPLVVKPTAQGSSRGVTVARNRLELLNGLEDAFAMSRRVMLEKHVEGREVNAAILDGRCLPLVEVVCAQPFFSYQAKYVCDKTRYVVNPDFPAEVKEAVETAALAAFHEMGCRHLARVEFIVDPEGRPHILEVNTLPGMTGHSLFPMAAAAAGLDMPALCRRLAELALS